MAAPAWLRTDGLQRDGDAGHIPRSVDEAGTKRNPRCWEELCEARLGCALALEVPLQHDICKQEMVP